MAVGSRVTLSDAERERVARVDALGLAGEEGVRQLIEMLTDPSWTVRRTVVATLGGLGDAALPALCRTLVSRRDDEARIAANVDALVASTGHAEQELEKLADHADPAVVADAAQILGRRRNAKSVPTLVRLSSHRDDNVAVAAIEALGRIGGRAAVDSLVTAVTSGNFFRIFPAIDVLGRSGDPRAVPPLANLLELPQYSLEAARALGRSGDRAAVGPLMRFMSRPLEAAVRIGAAALAELHDRYARRYGDAAPIEVAMREGSGGAHALVRKLTQALAGADLTEQAAFCVVLGSLGSEDAVPALAQLVDVPAPVGPAATTALRKLGRVADAHLARALADATSSRRRALLPLVARVAAVDEVVSCISDPDPAVRALACDTLARIGRPTAVNALFDALGDSNPAVVQAAIGAIQSLGSRETEALAIEAAGSSSAGVRRAAIRIIAYFGYPSSIEVLLRAVADEDPKVRDSALQGLALLDDVRANDALLTAVRDPSERTRAAATRALGVSGGGLRVAAYLIRALSDPAAWVRYYACQALGRIRAEAATAPIVNLLHDPAGQVRVAAVEALSHLESDAAWEALSLSARDADPDVRRASLVGLGIGMRPQSLPLLLDAAASPDAATRLVALSALSGFSAPDVVRTLAAAGRDSDENVRSAALGFLARQPGLEATATLIELLQADPGRDEILASLAFPVDGRAEGLVRALDTADDELAPHLTASLVRLQHADAEPALLEAFASKNVAARKAAASSLVALGSPAALAALQRASVSDVDPEVRRICALLLAR